MVVHQLKRSAFGVVRAYRLPRGSKLTHDPDHCLTLRDLTETTAEDKGPPVSRLGNADTAWGPFSSRSAFSLADWYWHSKNKSFKDFQSLLTILKQPDFSLSDALAVNWKATFKALSANREDLPEHEAEWIRDDGWKKTPVMIDVPFHWRMRRPGMEAYLAGTFYHRSIVSVTKEKIAHANDSRSFHYQPYKATWKPTDEVPEVELYGEMYSSRAFREAHEEVQALSETPNNEGLERVVVALMIWSDSTQLTSFGGVSLWPCYLFFGNESKYCRCQPSEHLGEQIAYFMKLSDTFDNYLQARNEGKLPTDGLFAHCTRELFQKQWGIMLDDELINAMKDGLVILCPDGRRCCFYPRIFTYSADYPEKTLVASLRNNGGRPCHHCLVEKGDIWKLGAPVDRELRGQVRSEVQQKQKVTRARKEIADGFAVDGTKIDFHLKEQSYVPVHNAFSARLSGMNFKIAPALVVDLMHEFEIGAWKRLFLHLIRLLDAFTSFDPSGSTLTADLDFRYRKTPSFGHDTIRSFAENTSETRRRAARDYEDLLQEQEPDLYIANFINKLKEHLLPRVAERLGFLESQFKEDDWANVALSNHRLYSHQLLRINYTTYDVRRDQDIIHVHTPQCNIMLLSDTFAQNPATASIHPYLYAKVLGVYHSNVSYVEVLPDGTQDLTSHRFDFVWTRWYDFLESKEEFILDHLSLKPLESDEALGFVDPSDILRSVHLIPQFSSRQLPPVPLSNRFPAEDMWNAYYINRFADRDLFMRYQYGMAVGHTYMHCVQPQIPSIPADFDHFLSFPEEDAEAADDTYVYPDSDDDQEGAHNLDT